MARRVRGACFLVATVVVASLGTSGGAAAGEAAPVPTVTGPITAGGNPSLLGPNVSGAGYEIAEYFFGGEATAYEAAGKLGANGRWEVEATETAPFNTRLVMWRPVDPAAFNGTVYVEWLNVSPGFDNPPDWLNGHNYYVREGAVWVGVSAQAASVNGGDEVLEIDDPEAPPAGGLRGDNPERYGPLEHPGDIFSYDVFSQAGIALRGEGEGEAPLDGYDVQRVIAMGESQSAFRMTTYVNAIHPLASVYDGFLIHSRGGGAAPFGDQDLGEDDPDIPAGTRIRSDVDVPVLIFQTEGDVLLLGYSAVNQRDTSNVRVWELAGAAHADAYLAGMSLSDLGDGSAELALLDPAQATTGRLGCEEPINAHGQYAAIIGALDALATWVESGTAPAKAPRLQKTGKGENVEMVRDENGIAVGGVRTPITDAPIALNDGLANEGGRFCFLFGHTVPFDLQTLAELYPKGEADWLEAFDAAADQAVEDGYWLEEEAEHFKAAARQITFG